MKTRFHIGRTSLAIVISGCILTWAFGGMQSAVRQAIPTTAISVTPYAGAISCSAQACHGGKEPRKDALALQNEFTTSAAYDRHVRAYAVLKEERAKRIAENLAPSNPDGKVIPAHEDIRCLACHTTPHLARAGATSEEINLRTEGIGCEACHGPANGGKQPWLVLHTVPSKWREKWEKSPQDPQWKEYSFTNLSDLAVQTETCAGCHVGAPAREEYGLTIPARDCNHDIMAAGHPRLNFEMATYRANMPPHWNQSLERKMDPERDAKVWAVGRVASARAALELTAARAKEAEQTKRWPEFAEYRCFSCHADFNPFWRDRAETYSKRRAGSLPLDPWYSTLVPELAGVTGGDAAQLRTAYAALEAVMASPNPARNEVADKTGELIGMLNRWLEANKNRKITQQDLEKLVAASAEKTPRTWEEAMQWTLAVVAIKQKELTRYQESLRSNPVEPVPNDLKALVAVLNGLAFPKLPRETDPKKEQPRFDSPKGIEGRPSDREQLKKDFAELQKLLKK